MQADAEVAEKLYQRAKGHKHPETKVFCKDGKIVTYEATKHYPPDTGAAIIWLKNRRSNTWRDRNDFTSDGEKIIPQIVSFLDVTKPEKSEIKAKAEQ